MKVIIFFIILIINVYAISLRDAVVKTLDSNPDVLAEKLNQEAFQKYVDEEEGDYYPTIDLEAYAEDSQTRSDRDDQPNDPSYAGKDGWYASLELEQVLYDGGLTPAEVEKYRHLNLSNRYRSFTEVDGIIRETITRYLELVRIQESLDITRLNIKVHEEYLDLAREKEEVSGEILESYQVNSKKHFIQNQYLEDTMTQEETKNILAQMIGTSEFGNVCRPIIDTRLIPKSFNEAIEDAVRKNNKILKAVEDIKEQRENIVIANAENLPTLKFQWKGSLDDDLGYAENGRQDISRFRLLLEWNLFEGGKDRASKQREILFLQEKQKILDSVVNEVTQEVKTLYTRYFNLIEKIDNYKKYVQDNLNIKKVYIKQLVDGTRTFIDILNAESEYFRSSNDLLRFEFELLGYYYDILEQRGMLSFALLSSPKQTCQSFVGMKYVSEFKKNKVDNSELEDVDLLKALGESIEDIEIEKSADDDEINNLINGIETPKNEMDTNGFPIGKYTINFGTFKFDFSLEVFLQDKKLDREKFFIYKSINRVHVLYGQYDNLMDAMKEVNALDAHTKFQHIFVDVLDKHKKLYEKYIVYNKVNEEKEEIE